MSRRVSQEVVDIKKAIAKRSENDDCVVFIHSGSTMVNLAGSSKGKNGGWARGRIGNIIGDGSSGKTLMALEAAANAFYNMPGNASSLFPTVTDVNIVFNNVEGVMDFPIEKMYGKKFVEGVDWIRTGTVEEFGRDYARRVMNLKPGQFLLYIVDSWDALTSEAGKERFEEAARKDKDEDASYGTEKAKYGSQTFFNNICDIMEGKDATLLIISQVREKIGITFGKKTYRTGGKALDFYTHQCCWLAEIKKLKKTFKGHDRIYGIRVKAKFERNKTAKPFREAEFIVLFDYGLDDIGSMMDFLWGPEATKINFEGADYSRVDLISYVEDNGLSEVLEEMCEEEWGKIEAAVVPVRKHRFENQEEE